MTVFDTLNKNLYSVFSYGQLDFEKLIFDIARYTNEKMTLALTHMTGFDF